MDVVLSSATGLGLRVYLIRTTSPTSFIAPAVLGLWEGILVHQLSSHPPPAAHSSPLDHYLALGIRLVVDLLLAGNWSRVIMVGLWTAFGMVLSESAFPSFSDSLEGGVHKTSSRRGREKRHRHSKPTPSHVPPHIRVYQDPDESLLPPQIHAPRQHTSTPIQPTIHVNMDIGQPADQSLVSPNRPPSPPSFFYADTEPSPFPHSPLSPCKSTTNTIVSQVPTRPTPALAFYGPENPPPPHPPSQSPHLPTPPDSTFRERTMDSRVDRLSTIDEITSRSEHISEDIEQGEAEGEENYVLVSHGGGTPLPIPNPTSRYIHADEGTPLTSKAPSATPSTAPLPIPPVPYSPQMPSDDGDELKTPSKPVYEVGPDSDPDPLLTPPTLRARTSQNATATSTPGGVNDPNRRENTLSPLMLDSQSIAPDQESIQVPGTTISTYAILQPPTAPRPLGPLLDIVTSGNFDQADLATEQLDTVSNASDGESVLSTRIPVKLLAHGEDLRKQAIEEGRELDRLRSELAKARTERRGRDILFLRGDIQNTEKRIEKLHRRAEKRFYAGRNNLQKHGTIDVHGLKPEEALRRTEKALRELLSDGYSTLRVIVGKGLHSKGGIPVVKNHIMDVMRNQYIPCEVDPTNTGVLILTLSPTLDHPLADDT